MNDYGIAYDHTGFHPTEEALKKLALSIQEAAALEKHEVHCPICNFLVVGIYGEKKGNINVKCQKCKYNGPLNLSYFRKMQLRKKYLKFEPERFGPKEDNN